MELICRPERSTDLIGIWGNEELFLFWRATTIGRWSMFLVLGGVEPLTQSVIVELRDNQCFVDGRLYKVGEENVVGGGLLVYRKR